MSVILSTAYLPPIEFFKHLKREDEVLLEKFETYPKQTYRNRCIILTANGPLTLTIPVVKPNGNRTLIKDVRIDNSVKWRKEHWRAMESAYRSSAFFEFIYDYLMPYYSKEWDFLWDFNLNIISTISDVLDINLNLKETKLYSPSHEGYVDLRNSISPKAKYFDTAGINSNQYYQVFGSRFGFVPNLSILDLLCNCGMESILYLSIE